jgi:large subunit ribosomal protein L23
MFVSLKPIISEKSFAIASSELDKEKRQYTFAVNKDINKIEIKEAIEKAYGVEVDKVRTISIKGKVVRWGKRRSKGKRSFHKKAIVTLKKGEIDLFKVS